MDNYIVKVYGKKEGSPCIYNVDGYNLTRAYEAFDYAKQHGRHVEIYEGNNCIDSWKPSDYYL